MCKTANQNQNKKLIVIHGSVFFIILKGLNFNNRRENRWWNEEKQKSPEGVQLQTIILRFNPLRCS